MSRFRGLQGLTFWPLLLALLCSAGCGRPVGVQSDAGAAPAPQHQVPFHDGNASAVARQVDPASVQGNGPSSEAGLPFHDPQNLPAGTLLTVRLKHSISAQNPGANATFEAIVDEPVVVDGNKLVPSGATVAGRVESARASNVRRNRGYVRLALDSIHLAGVNLPIQTSSLFVRGNAGGTEEPQDNDPQKEASTTVIRLEKGRRLTFRLTEMAYVLASQRAQVDQ